MTEQRSRKEQIILDALNTAAADALLAVADEAERLHKRVTPADLRRIAKKYTDDVEKSEPQPSQENSSVFAKYEWWHRVHGHRVMRGYDMFGTSITWKCEQCDIARTRSLL